MHFYYASADNTVKNWKLDKAKATNRLTTYYLIDGAIADTMPSPSIAAAGNDPRFLELRDRACVKALGMVRNCSGVESWVIDSGAYTYQQIKKRIPRDALMAYADRYIEFCKRSLDIWDWCAELDVEKVYGQDFVEEVWDKMIAAGLPALRVWHQPRGIDAFRRYCNERQYVGIGGLVGSSEIHKDDLEAILHWAYHNGNKIHLFGAIRNQLARLPCYSSDAISWLSPEAWGQIVKFDRGKGQLVRYSPRKSGLDLNILSTIANSRVEGEDVATIETVKELQAYEDYLTRSWAERGVTFDDPSSPQWVEGER